MTRSYLVSHTRVTKGNEAYLLKLFPSLASSSLPTLLPLAAELRHMVHVDTDPRLPATPRLQPSSLSFAGKSAFASHITLLSWQRFPRLLPSKRAPLPCVPKRGRQSLDTSPRHQARWRISALPLLDGLEEQETMNCTTEEISIGPSHSSKTTSD